MATEAWVKRGAERQELLRELMQKVYGVEEGTGGKESMGEEKRIWFKFDLIQVIAERLKQRVDPRDRQNDIDRFTSSFFFRDEILRRVEEFSRAEEETNQFLCELMERLQKSIMSQFQGELSKLEFYDPQRIFHAPSAMTEVPLNS